MGILQHDSKGTPQIILLYLIHVNPVVADLTVLNVVETIDQVCYGSLARTGGTHESNLLARFGVELHIMQHHLVVVITEIHTVEDHVSFQLHIIHGVIRLMLVPPRPAARAVRRLHKLSVLLAHIDKRHIAVVCFGRLIHHLKDSLRSGHGHDNGIELLTHLVNGHIEASVKGQEAGQFSKGQAGGPGKRQRAAHDGADHIAHITKLLIHRPHHINQIIGLIRALKQGVV